MDAKRLELGHSSVPSRASSALLQVKLAALRIRRWSRNRSSLPGLDRQAPLPYVSAELRSMLYDTECSDPAERALELGKIQNLRIVASRLDGLTAREGEV